MKKNCLPTLLFFSLVTQTTSIHGSYLIDLSIDSYTTVYKSVGVGDKYY